MTRPTAEPNVPGAIGPRPTEPAVATNLASLARTDHSCAGDPVVQRAAVRGHEGQQVSEAGGGERPATPQRAEHRSRHVHSATVVADHFDSGEHLSHGLSARTDEGHEVATREHGEKACQRYYREL